MNFQQTINPAPPSAQVIFADMPMAVKSKTYHTIFKLDSDKGTI